MGSVVGKNGLMSEPKWPVLPTENTPDFRTGDTRDYGTGNFFVLIESRNSSGYWTMETDPEITSGVDQARALAEDCALNYKPANPWVETKRQAFRINPDEYLVIIDGMSSKFHIRISIGQLL